MAYLNTFSDTRKKVTTRFGQYFGDEVLFGVLPIVVTSIINILFTLLLLILINYVPQAQHFVLDGINTKDPTATTLLICLASSFLQIFYFRAYRQYIIDANFVKIFEIANRYLFNFLPIYIWLIYLLKTLFSGELINCNSLHLVSISIGVVWILFALKLDRKLNEDLRSDSNSWTKEVTTYLILVYAVAFLINYILYTFFAYDLTELKVYQIITFNGAGSEGLPWVFKTILSMIALVYIVYYWIVKSEKHYSKIIHIGLIVLCIVFLVSIGSINSFDIIILYVIFLRSLFYYSRFLFRIIRIEFTNLFINGKLSKISAGLRIRKYFILFLKSLLLFFIVIFGLRLDSFWNYTRADRSMYNFIDSSNANNVVSTLSEAVEPKSRDRRSLDKYIDDWMSSHDSKEIYLIVGEGGGSRAGCATFNALSRLHSKIGEKILAITSVSGSSNGAGLYLGLRYAGYSFEIANVSDNSKVLYQRDFISQSLFKMLFMDRYLGRIPFLPNGTDRNSSLILKEQQALNNLIDKRNINYDEPDFFLNSWSNLTKDLPAFLPISYNVTLSKKAVISPYLIQETDLVDVQSQVKNSLTIGQGIALSEMFPFISASASINNQNYYDGGVYDNNGYEVAGIIYNRLKKNPRLANKKVMIISIENSKSKEANESDSELGALINAVTGSIFNHNPQMHLKQLKENLRSNDKLVRLSVVDENDEEGIVLSRYLSESEIDSIDSYAQKELIKFDTENALFSNKEIKITTDSMYLYFENNSDKLLKEEIEILRKRIGDINTSNQIILQGFCDANGSLGYNKGLRSRRVQSVYNYLNLVLNVPKSRLSVETSIEWYGINTDRASRKNDRKVKIKWIY